MTTNSVIARLPMDSQQSEAKAWFEGLRTRICAAFEDIEREAGSNARFDYIGWDREVDSLPPGEGGGGVRAVMRGQIFEKVGVNVSTVGGSFAPEFAKTVYGADENPQFFATGISLVAHMANPHVPAVHMNTRFLVTAKRWFGGGADLNPPLPYAEDTADFHAAFRAACGAHDPEYYPRFKAWAEDYFFIPHRGVHRGVGGIFYDHMEIGAPEDSQKSPGAKDFESLFALTRDVGEAFLDVFPRLVRRRMALPWTPQDKQQQLEWRGRYAEFNLIHDRGTAFGLKTGGNIDAILISLPPMAAWN